MAGTRKPRKPVRTFDARPDPLDFRDRMYEATLVEVPNVRPLEDYVSRFGESGAPILDQQAEGACTGFGLAAVANYLLRTRRYAPIPDAAVSARMLYEMARRYDEWPGEDYAGSSARGAIKGWHKHGVCGSAEWPYISGKSPGGLTSSRAADARNRPLGSYFRVNHKDLVAMHAAITEVGVLYATAQVHDGWQTVAADGLIQQSPTIIGGHAFAIVAYDSKGFWIQNSWGPSYGFHGFCKVTYDDWLENGTDVWVARLGVPVELRAPNSTAILQAAGRISSAMDQFHDLRPHIITLGNDGVLCNSGTFATNDAEVESIFKTDIPAITAAWSRKNILLYMHGGLTAADGAIQRVAEYRGALLEKEIYPISFIWNSDYWTTLKNILADALSRRRPEGFLSAAKDFLLDRADDALEPLARTLSGKAEWDEMKENAAGASASGGGARKVAFELSKLLRTPAFADCKVHLVGHSAGAVGLGALANLLASPAGASRVSASGFGIPIESVTLWAPACNIDFFKSSFGPVMKQIKRFSVFTLTDGAEQADDCANIYHKSLLYLVSNAFEAVPHVPLLKPGTPILGMAKWIESQRKSDSEFKTLFSKIDWVLAPNTESPATGRGSGSMHHGDFDDDDATVKSTLVRILNTAGKPPAASLARELIEIQGTAGSRRDRRESFQRARA
jgi:hypothetical protein